MKALAEFIMRGRMQASSVAMLGYIIPLLTPLVVASVTLRKGAFEGTLLLFISLMPALLSLALSESSPLLIWITLISLIVVFIPALLLRVTVSLSLALLGAVAVSVAISGLAIMLASDRIDELMALMLKGLAEREESQSLADAMVSHTAVSGMIAYILALNAISGLLLGRWVQALLYNPGGFGSEFRELGLNNIAAGICFFGSVICRVQGDDFWWWSNVLARPLILVALAIAHTVVKQREWSTSWLVLCYMAVFIVSPLMILIGFLDAWLNFRSRLQKQ
jgi:hypothetical protein